MDVTMIQHPVGQDGMFSGDPESLQVSLGLRACFGWFEKDAPSLRSTVRGRRPHLPDSTAEGHGVH
jgi:hypothetical protein